MRSATMQTIMELHGDELRGANKVHDANREDLQALHDELKQDIHTRSIYIAAKRKGQIEFLVEVAKRLNIRLRTDGAA